MSEADTAMLGCEPCAKVRDPRTKDEVVVWTLFRDGSSRAYSINGSKPVLVPALINAIHKDPLVIARKLLHDHVGPSETQRAVAAEGERCAAIVDKWAKDANYEMGPTLRAIADEIRGK